MNINTNNYKQLSISERIQLAQDIWDSVAEETQSGMRLSDQDYLELQRRLVEHLADPASSSPWEQIHALLFKQLS